MPKKNEIKANAAGRSGSKSGIVAIAGLPNVGKSTLLNTLLGQKLSIVSRKAQTTRQQVLGILTGEDYQIVFLDTPGVIQPRDKLQEFMTQASFKAVSGADLVIVMVEATERDIIADRQLLERISRVDVPRLLTINKVDLVKKPALLPLIAEYADTGLFEEILPISALKGEGMGELLGALVERLPEEPFLYSEDQLATQPIRFFAAELIRETLYELLHDELPYATTVLVEDFKERGGNKIYIKAIIYTERDSQKKIIIGRKGEQLKRIGRTARAKIEDFVESGVYLDLWVKVRQKWRKNDFFLKTVGYSRRNL
jgi:GTP-binding protein Era